MTSQDYVQAATVGNQQQNSLSKSLLHFFSSLDYGSADLYLKEAHRGNDILAVRIYTHDQIATVRDILVQNHAEHVKYVGTWAQANLSDSVNHGDW